MKVLKINYEYYEYPKEINNLETFVEYVNENTNRYIELTQLLEENCVAPYFIENDTEKCYLNLNVQEKIQEKEITVLSKEEYDKRLKECISKTCLDCDCYGEDEAEEDLQGFREKLNLNGKCNFKLKNIEEE